MSSDVAPNMHRRRMCRNSGRKYSKEKLHSEDNFSDRKTQHNTQ